MQAVSCRRADMPTCNVSLTDVPTCNVSLHYSPRPDPALNPPNAVRVLPLEPGKLHAATRAMNEDLIADVHADVRDTTTRLRREEQQITRSQGVDDRCDLRPRARLITADAR